jgi:hypothetical protein
LKRIPCFDPCHSIYVIVFPHRAVSRYMHAAPRIIFTALKPTDVLLVQSGASVTSLACSASSARKQTKTKFAYRRGLV